MNFNDLQEDSQFSEDDNDNIEGFIPQKEKQVILKPIGKQNNIENIQNSEKLNTQMDQIHQLQNEQLENSNIRIKNIQENTNQQSNNKNTYNLDELPEPMPIREKFKPQTFVPRLISKDNDMKKNPQILYQHINSDFPLKVNKDEIPSPLMSPDNEKLRLQTLYSKYVLNRQYKLIYSRYNPQSKHYQETNREKNFAGHFEDLNYLVDFGSSMFQELLESDIDERNYDQLIIDNENVVPNLDISQEIQKDQDNLNDNIQDQKDINESDYINFNQFQKQQKTQKCTEIKSPQKLQKNNIQNQNSQQTQPSQFQQQQQKEVDYNEFQFDSKFECGNLWSVYSCTQGEYDLIIRNDINTKGYSQWFYFSIKNKQKHQKIKINIVNFQKQNSQFSKGMKPAIFSIKNNKYNKKGWYRGGNNIEYYKNRILKETIKIRDRQKDRYSTLSFDYTFEYDDDTVYFAMNYPYSYSQMINHIELLNQKHKDSQSLIFTKQIFCHTISQNSVPLLTITSKNNNEFEKVEVEPTFMQKIQSNNKNIPKTYIKKSKKKIAIILARQHPGETISSHVMHGFLDNIVSDNKQAKYLRDKYIFKIIPMVNIDGVIYGNFRCNLAGVDLNRQWLNPNRIFHPVPFAVKQMIKQLQAEKYEIDLFADLHGHSKKPNSFIYACSMEEDPYACRIFPRVFSKMSDIFSYNDCTYGIDSYKSTSARGVVFNNLKTPNIFTVETSFFGYTKDQEKIHFTPEVLFQIGNGLCNSLYLYTIKEDLNLYPFTMDSIKKEVIEIYQKMPVKKREQQQQDSGSDSDPLADELDPQEKIKSFIPESLAKGLQAQKILFCLTQ